MTLDPPVICLLHVPKRDKKSKILEKSDFFCNFLRFFEQAFQTFEKFLFDLGQIKLFEASKVSYDNLFHCNVKKCQNYLKK